MYILVEKINNRLLKEAEQKAKLHGFKLKNTKSHYDENLFLDKKTEDKIKKFEKNILKDYFGNRNGTRN